MTAEIAILNSQAVALAADSAVTISDGTSRVPKIYNTVNKLFTLSKHEPVGVMIYGSAELGGLPVETAVKVFRDQLGRRAFGSLKEYADSFLDFLGTSPLLFPQDRQDRFVYRGAFRLLSRIKQDLDLRVKTRIGAEGEIYPFAQTEMVSTFMEGISPKIKATIYDYMHRVSEELPKKIADDAADGGMPSDQRDNIRDGLRGILRSAEEQLQE